MHSLLVVACACAALAASPFARSQSPATATLHEQEAKPAPQTQADEQPGFGITLHSAAPDTPASFSWWATMSELAK